MKLQLMLAAVVASLSACKKGPCPDDAVLVGDAPPGGLSQWCQRTTKEGSVVKHGRFRRWYPSGQIAEDNVYAQGVVQKAVGWTEDGRKVETWYEEGEEVQAKDYTKKGFVVTYNVRDKAAKIRIDAENGDFCDATMEPPLWDCRYKGGGQKFKMVGEPPNQGLTVYYKSGNVALSRDSEGVPFTFYSEDGQILEATANRKAPTKELNSLLLEVAVTMAPIMNK